MSNKNYIYTYIYTFYYYLYTFFPPLKFISLFKIAQIDVAPTFLIFQKIWRPLFKLNLKKSSSSLLSLSLSISPFFQVDCAPLSPDSDEPPPRTNFRDCTLYPRILKRTETCTNSRAYLLPFPFPAISFSRVRPLAMGHRRKFSTRFVSGCWKTIFVSIEVVRTSWRVSFFTRL